MMADVQSEGSTRLCLDQVEEVTGILPPVKHTYILGDHVGETGKVLVREMQVFVPLRFVPEWPPEFTCTVE